MLKEAILGIDLETQLKRRKLHIWGLTIKKQFKEVRKLIHSNSKANRAIVWFIDIFWTNFFERLWKFCYEVISNWEKNKGINLRKKRSKKKKLHKAKTVNKENSIVIETINKETISFKSERILKEANNKIKGWIEGGKKEE